MNVSDISSKSNRRLNRIKKVSRYLRLTLQYGIPLWILFCLSLVVATHFGLKLPPQASQMTNTVPHEWLLSYGFLRLFLFIFWYRTLVKLFGFFENGIFFTSETVRCLKALGSVYLVGFLLALLFHFTLHKAELLFGVGLEEPFTGFFIIFIGWLIDEARKLREEQELTV